MQNYFTYILTNKTKTVLYTGVTNNLKRRLFEHKEDAIGSKNTFAGKYNCYYLVCFERFQFIEHAIKREKEIKGWVRRKKEKLISDFNSEWRFLNDEVDSIRHYAQNDNLRLL
ncbi:MAG: GIY-YIG nuclease family protein [Bacteroidales bacterium]|nr:GIY-YIG nuclease family protein [Bacteroidales bacterium]